MKNTGISLTVALCALILSLLPSCRMNNGDIGDFFGTWYMESMTVDGEPNPELPHERLFWSFQNHLICITITTDHHDSLDSWGSWQDEDGLLYLDFTHSEGDGDGGLPPYAAPAVLMFPPNSVVALRFAERSPRQMRLEWTDDAGRRIVYELKKTW